MKVDSNKFTPKYKVKVKIAGKGKLNIHGIQRDQSLNNELNSYQVAESLQFSNWPKAVQIELRILTESNIENWGPMNLVENIDKQFLKNRG